MTPDERAAWKQRLQSLSLVARPTTSKTTVDVHDRHVVHVTESGSDRQDVTVKAPVVKRKTTTFEEF